MMRKMGATIGTLDNGQKNLSGSPKQSETYRNQSSNRTNDKLNEPIYSQKLNVVYRCLLYNCNLFVANDVLYRRLGHIGKEFP